MKVGKPVAEKAIRAAQSNAIAAVALPSLRTAAELKDACRQLEAEAAKLSRLPGELILVVVRVG